MPDCDPETRPPLQVPVTEAPLTGIPLGSTTVMTACPASWLPPYLETTDIEIADMCILLCTKLAVIVPVPLIVAVVEAELVLAKVMEPVATQLENWYPVLAVADMASEPEFSQTFEPVGLVVPDPITMKLTWYWCV